MAIILLVPMGAASISFIATNNATLQLRAHPAMRGRVMSLNAVAFLGSTPIGATLLGYISDVTSPRVALVIGGVATLLASVPLFFLAKREREARRLERGTNAVRRRRRSSVRGVCAPRHLGPAMAEGWTLHRDRRRAGSFGDDAELYDRVRPPYPPAPGSSSSSWPRGRARCSTSAAAPGLRPGCSQNAGATCSGWSPTRAWRR